MSSADDDDKFHLHVIHTFTNQLFHGQRQWQPVRGEGRRREGSGPKIYRRLYIHTLHYYCTPLRLHQWLLDASRCTPPTTTEAKRAALVLLDCSRSSRATADVAMYPRSAVNLRSQSATDWIAHPIPNARGERGAVRLSSYERERATSEAVQILQAYIYAYIHYTTQQDVEAP